MTDSFPSGNVLFVRDLMRRLFAGLASEIPELPEITLRPIGVVWNAVKEAPYAYPQYFYEHVYGYVLDGGIGAELPEGKKAAIPDSYYSIPDCHSGLAYDDDRYTVTVPVGERRVIFDVYDLSLEAD